MTRRLALLALLVLATVPLATPSRSGAASVPRYTVIDLGTLGGPNSAALSLNERGVVVGWSEASETTAEGRPLRKPFRWTARLGMQPLPIPRGESEAEARDVNSYGTVVGAILGEHDQDHDRLWELGAVVWPRGRVPFLIPPGSPESSYWVWLAANAINDRGEIAGQGANFSSRAGFLRSRGRTYQVILTNSRASALDINRTGTLIGYAASTSSGCAVAVPVGRRGRGWVPLGVSHDPGGIARGINSRDVVVGGDHVSSDSSDGTYLAFVWRAGKQSFLPSPRVSAAPYWSTEATAINDREQIVGLLSYVYPGQRALLWQGGQVFFLTQLLDERSAVWTISDARAINNRGEIAAVAHPPGQPDVLRAVLLRPVRG